jgi:hypothetical protein
MPPNVTKEDRKKKEIINSVTQVVPQLWLWISLLIAELQNKSRKTPEIRSSLFPQLKYGGMHNQDASTFMVCRG